MSTAPDISVVIVTWNTRQMTLGCLEALYAGLGTLGAEVFVVDNGSSDGTAEAVARRFPSVKMIANENNRGFAAANNQAMRPASGRYVLLLNSDAVVEEDTLAGLVEFMDSTPGAGAAGAQLVSRSGKLENSAATFPSLATELLNKSLLRLLKPSRFAAGRVESQEPVRVDSVLGACMIVRSETIEEVGMLDEDYFFFLEETDWCRRMREAGRDVYLLPTARAVHLKGASKSAFRAAARVEYHRSLYKYFRKHRGGGARLALRAGKFVRIVLNSAMLLAANALTVFSLENLRGKMRVYALLLGWHLAFCPDCVGLPRDRIDSQNDEAE